MQPEDKWKRIEKLLSSDGVCIFISSYSQCDTIEKIILTYSYPRLDKNVSLLRHHLLKSPFIVHPKSRSNSLVNSLQIGFAVLLIQIRLNHLSFQILHLWMIFLRILNPVGENGICSVQYRSIRIVWRCLKPNSYDLSNVTITMKMQLLVERKWMQKKSFVFFVGLYIIEIPKYEALSLSHHFGSFLTLHSMQLLLTFHKSISISLLQRTKNEYGNA